MRRLLFTSLARKCWSGSVANVRPGTCLFRTPTVRYHGHPASLFDFGSPVPAPAASSDSDDANDEEDEIMAESEAEDVGEENAIAA